ncbi:class D sortase [Halobacillus massiliensis]|uniref:class D sortase n=1 Tax=Halobacillus massiliensis TaxID=1926286 RepID=UPI0009E53207|nr:class D sortase [Halobacillus massiliensis]
MKKLSLLLVAIGFFMVSYYGFQWWQSSQAFESISEEEMKEWAGGVEDSSETAEDSQSNKQEEIVKKPIKSGSAAPESPLRMSDEMEDMNEGEEIGRLVIPKLEKGYHTYWGADDDTLEQGVGMYVSQWTTTPDEERHTVLSGHRDTVFSELKNIEKGDSLFLEFEGKRYEYVIQKTWITDAEDRSVIVDKETPTLTLTTCYPFEFLGDAPDRYIIESELVNTTDM